MQKKQKNLLNGFPEKDENGTTQEYFAAIKTKNQNKTYSPF